MNEIFKNVVDLHPAMLTLFNRILSTGHFPIQWTEGIIVPIYKKGDRDSTTNYRGVNLLDTLSKMFTKLINTRISGRRRKANSPTGRLDIGTANLLRIVCSSYIPSLRSGRPGEETSFTVE